MRNGKICIFISAYIANNLGDDMFVTYLCHHYPWINFYLLCPEKYVMTFKEIKNLVLISNMEQLDYLKKIIDFQVFIGGSLFMEPKQIENIETKFESTISCRLSSKIPFFVIGANFGEYSQQRHLELYTNWFKTIDGICFRDFQSYRLFQSFDNMIWAPDLIFSYNMPSPKKTKSILIAPIYNNNRIGLPNFSNEQYFDFLANIAIYYITINYNIILAAFCKSQLDDVACEEIYKRIPSKIKDSVTILEYENNINSFLNTFVSAEYIIGTRFHSIILSWKNNIPVFPIIYNIKSENVIKDYEFKGNYMYITEIGQKSFDFIDHNRKKSYIPDFKSYEKQSKLHFCFLNEAIIEQLKEVIN